MWHGFKTGAEGVIYRTASGLQAYYPRVVRLADSEYLASFNAGRGIETPDTHPELARSTDGGKTWVPEGPVDAQRSSAARGDPERLAPTEMGFITRDEQGTLFCSGSHYPRNPADPFGDLVHPKTVGMRDNRIIWRRSTDGGRTWSPSATIPHPFPCPLEIPTGLLALDEHTFIQSFATWKRWDGSSPCGQRVALVRSMDAGHSWSPPTDVFFDSTHGAGFWEGRIAPMGANCLLATCWTHTWHPDEDAPNHYALSRDNGLSWSPPRPSPVMGQTGWPLWLEDNCLFFLYNHRRAPVGVRGQLAQLEHDEWHTVFDGEVWSPANRAAGAIAHDDYAVPSFQFGAPSVIRLDERRLMAVFWCVVNSRAGINWVHISLQ